VPAQPAPITTLALSVCAEKPEVASEQAAPVVDAPIASLKPASVTDGSAAEEVSGGCHAMQSYPLLAKPLCPSACAAAHLWQVPKKQAALNEAKKAAVDPSGSAVLTGVGPSPQRPTRAAKVRSVK
jgi:hypothetical protein